MSPVQMIMGTPIWVWLLFGFLVMRGLKAKSVTEITPQKLLTMPLVFIGWSILSLAQKTQATPLLALAWPVALIFGGSFAWLALSDFQVSRTGDGKIVLPPREYLLYVLVGVFCVKYFFGVSYAIHPEVRHQLLVVDIVFSGLVSGFFSGQAALIATRAQVFARSVSDDIGG